MRRWVFLLLFASLSCKQAPPPTATAPQFAAINNYPSAQALLDASAARVPAMDPAATPELTGVWRWVTPERQTTVLIWSVCKGSGDTKSCVVFAGDEGTRVQISVECPSGWDAPKLESSSNRSEILIKGSDGRSEWTRVLSLKSGNWTCGEQTRPEGS